MQTRKLVKEAVLELLKAPNWHLYGDDAFVLRRNAKNVVFQRSLFGDNFLFEVKEKKRWFPKTLQTFLVDWREDYYLNEVCKEKFEELEANACLEPSIWEELLGKKEKGSEVYGS